MVRDKKRILPVFIYVLSAVVFASQLVLSFYSITPYLRIAVTLAAMVFLYAGSAVAIYGKDYEAQQKIMYRTFLWLFCIFVFLFAALVFVDSYFGDSRLDVAEKTVYLIPLEGSSSLIYSASKGWITIEKPIINIGGNLLLCVPFALFLPLLFKKQQKFLVFFATVFLLVLSVELCQLAFSIGICDIDDLIFNVGGASIGFALFHIPYARKLIKRITKLEY